MHRADSLELLQRFSEESASPAEVQGFQRMVAAWLHAREASLRRGDPVVSLERFLRVPTTDKGWMRLHRDNWLCTAFSALLSVDPSATPADLHEAWIEFATRGAWRAWRDDGDPPEGADALSQALFYATKFTRGRDSSGVASLSTVERALAPQN